MGEDTLSLKRDRQLSTTLLLGSIVIILFAFELQSDHHMGPDVSS